MRKSELITDILSDYKAGRISIKDAIGKIDSLPSQISHFEEEVEEYQDVIENSSVIIMDMDVLCQQIADKVLAKLNK